MLSGLNRATVRYSKEAGGDVQVKIIFQWIGLVELSCHWGAIMVRGALWKKKSAIKWTFWKQKFVIQSYRHTVLWLCCNCAGRAKRKKFGTRILWYVAVPWGARGKGGCANSAAHFLGKPDTSAAVLCQRTPPPVRPKGRAWDGFLESPTMPTLMADSEHGSVRSWAVRLPRPHSGPSLIHPMRNWCYLDRLNCAKTSSSTRQLCHYTRPIRFKMKNVSFRAFWHMIQDSSILKSGDIIYKRARVCVQALGSSQ